MNRPIIIDTSDPNLENLCKELGIEYHDEVQHFQSSPPERIIQIGGRAPLPNSVATHLGFSVGDLVRLNRKGLSCVHGLNTPEQVAAQMKGVKLTEIFPDSDNPSEPGICLIDLESPLDYMLTLDCIEKV